jgi:hypothetical protein
MRHLLIGLLLTLLAACWADTASAEATRLFLVDFGSKDPYEQYKVLTPELPGFYNADPAGSIGGPQRISTGEAGRPLSPTAVRLFEDLRSGGLGGSWMVMPLGKTDQAVAFQTHGKVSSTRGSISFLFQGQGWDYTPTQDKNKDVPHRTAMRTWDVSTPLRETFFELRAPGSTVSFGKLAPGQLVLEGPGNQRLAFTIDFDVALVHQITINYDDGKTTLLIDGVIKGEGPFTMPRDIDEIVIGHIGPGAETWNRWLDDFAIWDRPLTESDMARRWRQQGAVQLPLQVTMPKFATTPTIDGIIQTGEWNRAATVMGMHAIHIQGGFSAYADGGDLSDLKDRIALGYDDKFLYIYYHCPPPREIVGNTPMIAAMLKKGITVFDANVDADDAFHLQVQYPAPGGDLYNLYVNGIDTRYDFTFAGHVKGSRLGDTPGFITLGWDPSWKTASTLDMEGWHLEMAIPLEAFAIPAPAVGDVWHMNFMRCWHTIRTGIQSWAWGNRGTSEEGHARRGAPAGRVVFGDTGVVTRQQSIGEISQGKPHFITELVNTAAQPRTVICTVTTNSGELTDEKTITIPAGGTTAYEYVGRIVDFRTSTITLTVRDAASGTIITSAGYPVLRPQKADTYLRKYPSRGLVRYEVDFINHAAHDPAKLSLDVQVTNQHGKRVWQQRYAGFTDYHAVVDIPTAKLPEGTYHVALIFRSGRKELERVAESFDKNPLPAWYGNTLGHDQPDEPPYPWSDIVVKGNTVSLWGRTYDFGDTLYPKSVTTQGKETLRAPMGLTLETADGPCAAGAVTTDIEWTKLTNSRVEGIRRVRHGNLTLENRFSIEYDGLVWSNLTLIPDGEAAIQSLAFEIPFTPQFSDVINATDYSMRNTGKLKPEGYTGSPGSIWLGNGVGGIQWTTETVGPYEVQDVGSSLRVLSAETGGTIRVEFINRPITLTAPLEIPFGFVATPVRPKLQRTAEGDAFRRNLLAIGHWQDTEENWVPFQDHWVNKHQVRNGRMYGPNLPGIEARTVHHTTLHVMAANDPAMQEFGDEWLSNESERWRGKYANGRVAVTTASRSLQDYYAWRFKRFFDQNPVPGGYFDVSDPVYSSNPDANAGYRRQDGSIAPTLSLLGHRQIAKRIYNIQNTVFPGGGLWWHASIGPHMVYESYVIGIYDGENGNSFINAHNPTYHTLLRPDTFRAQYMGSNFGHWNHFLSQGRITEAALKQYGFSELWDQWTGLQWLHDCYRGTGWFGRLGHLEGYLTERELVPFNRYHLFSPFNRFIPYWEQQITKLERPEFFASFYVKTPLKPVPHYGLYAYQYYSNYDTGLDGIHQAVVVLYNHGDYTGPVQLDIDWKQLGFDDWRTVTAINAVHATGFRVKDWDAPKKEGELYDNSAAEYARIENGQLVFPISPYNYRMIVLQTPRPWSGQR